MKGKQVAVALMSNEALSKLIGRVGRASANLANMIQEAAVQCVAQSVVHRNATPAMQLFDAVGTASRRDALVAYFEKFGNLTWSKAEKRVIFCDMEKIPNGRKLEWTEEYAEKVAAERWEKATPEPTPKSIFDVDEEASKFIDRMKKARGKAKEFKNATLLDRLIDTYNQWVGEQYIAKATALPTAAEVQSEAAAGNTASVEKLQQLQEKFGGTPTPVKMPVAAGAGK